MAACAACAPRPRDLFLRWAERRVRLRVAGPTLATLLTRAFAPLLEVPTPPGENHPSDAADPVELCIHAWDRAHTGIGCPGLPLVPDRTDVLGQGLMFQFRAGHLLRYERSTIVKCLDRERRELFLCVQDAAQLGLNDRTKPFPHFLDTWAHDRRLHVLHAGLVARSGHGVLVGGGNGSGKSTTAIACALGGLDFLGDDAVATAVTENGCVGHALYNAVRVEQFSLDRFPVLREPSIPPTRPSDRNKFLVYMSEVLRGTPARPVASARLAAIVMPTIQRTGATFLRRVSRGETLRRLAPSTLLRGLGGGAAGLSHMAEIVRRLPCYELVLGTSVEAAPALIHELLDGSRP
jgi:hypothetical protein